MKNLNVKSYEYFLFLGIFLLLMPLGYAFGIISVNTMSLWGRYFCFAIAAIGIDMLWGYTGILCMSQALFFGLGGYGIAMHMLLNNSGSNGMPEFMQWNQVDSLPLFWMPFQNLPLTLIFSLLIPALFAFTFGFFIFRSGIKGVYFAIITQALALAMWLLFLRNETMLGGTNGLTDFKTLAGMDLSSNGTKIGLYFASFLTLVAIYLGAKKLVNSKFGKVLVAIRDSEFRLKYASYKVENYKVTVFILAAVIAAIGGMLYVPQTGIITPGRMDVKASVEMIVWVALGGRGNLRGAILGTLIVNLMYSLFTTLLPGAWLYILGILFIVTVLYLDKGLIGLPKQIKGLISKPTKA